MKIGACIFIFYGLGGGGVVCQQLYNINEYRHHCIIVISKVPSKSLEEHNFYKSTMKYATHYANSQSTLHLSHTLHNIY